MKKAGMHGMVLAFLVPIALLAALASWAFSSPLGASPDDDYHMASIWCGGGTDDLCEQGLVHGHMRVPEILIASSACFAFEPESSGTCSDQPSNGLVDTTRGNFAGGYPPLYYGVMSVFSGSDFSASVLLMRVFNALLFVSVTTTLFFFLPQNRRAPILWGGLITIVPLGMFLIPSVNPSSWAILSAVTLWITLSQYLSSASRKSQVTFGALAVLATIIGAGARGDAAVYAVLAVVIALVTTFEGTRRFAVLSILPAALIIVAVAFFLTAGQSGIVVPISTDPEAPQIDRVSLAVSNLTHLPELWTGAFGTTGLGWLDTKMPGIVWVSTLGVFFSTVFWGLQRLGRRKTIALGLIVLSLIVVPMYVLVNGGVAVGTDVQPRYIYPLIIMLGGLALFRIDRDDLRMNRFQLGIIAFVLVIANSVALHANIRRYVTGIDVQGGYLDASVEWWWEIPVSPMAMWAIGSASFSLAVLGAYIYSTRCAWSQRESKSRESALV